MNWSKQLLKLSRLLFPDPITCLGCRTNLLAVQEFLLCEDCYRTLVESRAPQYYRFQTNGDELKLLPCSAEQREILCLYPYSKILQRLIHAYKFQHYKDCARLLADSISFELARLNADCIVPIPSTKTSCREKGFDQMVHLAQELSQITGLPLIQDALQRMKNNRHQVGLRRQERLLNVKDNFLCTQSLPGMRALLLDDVLTTGATVYYARKALQEKGASVIIATLAHARAGN